jgi:hypothetical protein
MNPFGPTLRFQMIAQDRLGAPLRQAALKLVCAAGVGKRDGRDLLKTGADELNAPDMHARAQERLDQAGPLDAFQNRGLQGGPARLVMRRCPELDDPGHDAMTHELAGREQARRAGSDDQDARGGCRFDRFTGFQGAVLLEIRAMDTSGMLSRIHLPPT